MPDLLPDDVPDEHRDRVGAALATAFDAGEIESVRTVPGGASGALTLRVDATAGAYLLRAETLGGQLRNPHQYECMQTAADAGIAPPVRYADPEGGIAVITWIDQRPVADHPDVVAGGGRLLARLHETSPVFPHRGDHLENLAGLLHALPASGRVAPGLLDRHGEVFERLRAGYPWDPSSHVSSHNDPNQFNLLSDGERLWLIDWETASRNDPLIDVATVAGHLAPTPDAGDVLLRAWLGRAPDDDLRQQVATASRFVSLFAGCMLLLLVTDPDMPVHTDLTPLSMAQFGAQIASGELAPGRPATTLAFAKIALQQFLEGVGS